MNSDPNEHEQPQGEANDAPATVLTNTERLRMHLTPGGLAVTLMDAWKSDDPEAQEGCSLP